MPAAPAISDGLIYPEAAATGHHDLPSFMRYAERSGLDQASKVFIGTHYEYTAAAALRALGFYLRRIGGASDRGIDLLGTWAVPSASQPLHVMLQCKATARPAPHLIRELEGAVVGAPAGWRGPSSLGLLVTDKKATKGIRDALGRSRWPMGFVSCSRTGQLEQILWNRRAEEEGLEGMGVGIRYPEDGTMEQQLVLTFKGKHLPPGTSSQAHLPGQDASEPTAR